MELKKINGNTYYIPSATNIGVFLFKDKYTLLMDSGNNNQQAKKISDILVENHMNIKYILNTHHHIDHAGGNTFLKEHFPGSIVYTSGIEKLFIEHDEFFPTYVYGANPIKELAKEFVSTKNISVDFTLDEGNHKINNEKFDIISLPGHSKGQIGIGTRDRVCFLGDALFSKKIIDKYSFPFLFDIKEQFHTFEKIKDLDYDYYVLSHSDEIYSDKEIKDLVQINKDNVNKYLELILELLHQPKTREEILEEITILEELNLDLNEYYFSLSTVGSMITYLYEQENLSYQIENGKLYYYHE